MNIIAFGASNSKTSINKQLASYAASLLTQANVEILDLNDYELPLFSIEKEQELGYPEAAKQFVAKIQGSDAVIISFAEHNGSYSAAYKNLFDWCSRITQKVFQDKKLLLLSTSPGGRGGETVLAAASQSAPYFGADVKASIAVPSFYDNFDTKAGIITDTALVKKIQVGVQALST